jgi:hypothetical protein
MRVVVCLLVGWLCVVSSALAEESSVDKLIEQVRSVGPKGENHPAAVEAVKKLQALPIGQLTHIIAGMDGANPLATNWLRGVAESIALKHTANGGKLPVDELEKLFANTKHAPRGRRLAYELVATVDPTAEKRLIPSLQTDPSLELRYDAIRLAMEEAAALDKSGEKEAATKLYGQAFVNARDLKQTKALAAKLKERGQTVDMPTRLGFIMRWQVIGPFDNTGDKGWDVAYEPEKKIDLKSEYEGKEGRVKWTEFATADEYGVVDLNKAIGKHKGAAAYAVAEFISPQEQEVDVRIGCINASKVWVNGELVTANRVYHTGMEIDQYRGAAKLKAGENYILVKVCQNEQTEMWAQDWKFQLRVCDSLGGPLLSADRVVPKTAAR